MKVARAIQVLVAAAILIGSSASNVMAVDFAVNPYRIDPYKQFKFRVKWDGRYVSGIFNVSGLSRTTKVVSHRSGNEVSLVRQLPGETSYDPIVLERGRTHDDAFEQWANKVWNLGSGAGSESSLGDFRKDIIIDLYNEAGQLVMAFKVRRCWPSHYVALQELDANSTGIAVESITLQHEGWERDYDVAEPTQPTFTEPQ